MKVETVFGLVPDDGIRAINYLVGYLFSAVGGQAVHHHYLGGCALQKVAVHLVGTEDFFLLFRLFLTHAHPGVGVDKVNV